MKPILYIKGSTSQDVRLKKFISFFKENQIPVYFVGWRREKSSEIKNSNFEKYIFSGGGIANKYVFLCYPFWMTSVFLYFLFKKKINNYNIIAINFDVAFPLFLVSKFRKFNFTYEIYDQFALSYNFPKFIKKVLLALDKTIIKKASLVIQVDKNRVDGFSEKTIIIENTPYDYYMGQQRSYDKLKHKFAITGLLNNARGLDSILNFAKNNPSIEFLLVGTINDNKLSLFASKLPNVIKKEYMPQSDLFASMEDCCGIFSLYNPELEINRFAASNKVYDSIMMGIPVITNKEVLNSDFIRNNNIGYVINYHYDESWEILSDRNFISKAIKTGRIGRELYLEKYVFDKILTNKLLNGKLFT